MVINSLSPEIISAGVRLLEELDQEHIAVDGAFWMFDEEQRAWKLMLSLPEVTEEGPRSAYRKIQGALQRLVEEPRVELQDIALLKPDSPLLKTLRSVIQTGPKVANIRFSNNVINGQAIPDALIYRVQ